MSKSVADLRQIGNADLLYLLNTNICAIKIKKKTKIAII